ncbi:MAG: type II toxin-antitoxin system VapC family toxin [Pseudomonadota bacterium]|nr:type II toxin-antitoxin system VapC family toxin [Pseudomonadota bacterium]MEA3240892.1 type II toxin-antitoxin system VapC family toxin [Pseudomonadota bacterium]
MKLLLDTCTFLWLTKGREKLSVKAIDAFTNPQNEVFLSAVSAWEINVKYRLEKLQLPLAPDQFIPKERKRHLISPLNLSEQDTLHLCKLPTPHKDPFDRMLVCQAIEHSLTIITPDPLIRQYPIRCLW